MEYTPTPVRDINAGMTVRTVLAVVSAVKKQARNGPFWLLELKDATGSIEARIWSPKSLEYTTIDTGILAYVEGSAELYRDKLQLSVSELRVLEKDEYAGLDLSMFAAASRFSPEKMLGELEQLCDEHLTFKPWRKFICAVLTDPTIRDPLLRAPAAREIHHAWVGGLLEHTLGVCRLCLSFAELYPHLDKQILLVGAVCHDLGKLYEFSDGLSTEYTDKGRLIGHITIGTDVLAPYFEKSDVPDALRLHAVHMILSHHGLREYGSPILPQTAEAIALHYADNIGAKMAQCRALFDDAAEPGWSPYQKTLDRAVYLAPKTPEPTDDTNASPHEADAVHKTKPGRKKEAQSQPAKPVQELQQCLLV